MRDTDTKKRVHQVIDGGQLRIVVDVKMDRPKIDQSPSDQFIVADGIYEKVIKRKHANEREQAKKSVIDTVKNNIADCKSLDHFYHPPQTMLVPRIALDIAFAPKSKVTLTSDFTIPITVDSGITPLSIPSLNT